MPEHWVLASAWHALAQSWSLQASGTVCATASCAVDDRITMMQTAAATTRKDAAILSGAGATARARCRSSLL